MRVVQTTLEEEEYRTFLEVLKRRHLSLKEGLHLAVTRLLQRWALTPSYLENWLDVVVVMIFRRSMTNIFTERDRRDLSA